jgi:hypothetical protein
MKATTSTITTWGMTDHNVTITGLTKNTVYFYTIVGYDIYGNSTTSPLFLFTTANNHAEEKSL